MEQMGLNWSWVIGKIMSEKEEWLCFSDQSIVPGENECEDLYQIWFYPDFVHLVWKIDTH